MTRQDLSAGAQVAQAVHACCEFIFKYFDLAQHWNQRSNFIAILAAKDEAALEKLIKTLEQKNIRFAYFRESDLDNQITAVAIEPGERGKKVTSCFPLALKYYQEVR